MLARGLLNRVVTRIYFADEADANAADPVLSGLSEAQRATLIAEPADGGHRFDIHLQGADETAFFTPLTASARGARCSATSTSTARRPSTTEFTAAVPGLHHPLRVGRRVDAPRAWTAARAA